MTDDFRNSITTIVIHCAIEAARDFTLTDQQVDVYRKMFIDRLKL